jgi:AraC family transcriptional regulator
VIKPAVLYHLTTPDYGVRLVRYAPSSRMPRHTHDEYGLSLVVQGEVVEEAEHRTVVASAGWIVSKPAGVYHENRFGPTGAMLIAFSPAEHLSSLAPSSWRWASSPGALRSALRLLSDDSGDGLAEVLASVASPARGARDSRLVRIVRDALDAGSKDGVTALARTVGMHPVYLARAFRAAFGLSIREYRRQRQVCRAVQLITTTKLPLAQVALDCGFADHSHMCRAFRAAVRRNPARFRGEVRNVQPRALG